MTRHRLWIAALVFWPVAIAIAQQAQVVRLAPFLPIYCLVCALSLLLVARLRSVPILQSVAAPVVVFLVIRAAVAGEAPDGALPTAVTEVLAVCLTVLLSRRVGQDVEGFEAAVERSMSEHLPMAPEPLDATQGEIYSELRRARSFERPLTFLAISAADMGTERTDELIAEVQRKSLGRYVRARIAVLLSEEMRDYDIVSIREDHIVTVLPETGAEQAQELAERLRASCRGELGIELKVGSSSFPDQELTFEKLLKRAEAEMRGEPSAAIVPDETPAESAKLTG